MCHNKLTRRSAVDSIVLTAALAFVGVGLAPGYAAAATAELFADYDDGEYQYAITVYGLSPRLARKDINKETVQLKDSARGVFVAVDDVQGGVVDDDALTDIAHLDGAFDPAAEYAVVVKYGPNDVGEYPVQKSLDAIRNSALDRYLTDIFDIDLDVLVAEDAQELGLSYYVKPLSILFGSFRLEVSSDGTIQTDPDKGALQNELTGGAFLQFLPAYAVPFEVRVPTGRRERRYFKYFYGVQADVIDFEMNQQRDVVDYTFKARGVFYFPLDLLAISYYEAVKRIGLVKGNRRIMPPYVFGGYSQVYHRDAKSEEFDAGPRKRVDVDVAWTFPLAGKTDLSVKYGRMFRLEELRPGQNRSAEFVDLRARFYLDDEMKTGFEGGYQKGKLPPAYEHADTLYAGFNVSVF